MSGRVVELAGLAGAGKTTLATALVSGTAGMSATVGVDLGRMRTLLDARSAVWPVTAARMSSTGRWPTRSELRSMAYLQAWPRELGSELRGDVILDHGGVYRLASLLATGPPLVHTHSFMSWWRSIGQEWASLLDTVVWLDAPDEVLLRRIDERARHHRVRGASRPLAETFLARYRRSYAQTLDLMAREGVRVARLESASSTPAELATTVRELLTKKPAGPSP